MDIIYIISKTVKDCHLFYGGAPASKGSNGRIAGDAGE